MRDLLDSLYRGYPSGVILTWQGSSDVAKNEFAVPTEGGQIHRSMLLPDGQQRFTSLSAVLRGELIQVHERKRPIDILFNLGHPDQTIFAATGEEEVNETDWLRFLLENDRCFNYASVTISFGGELVAK